MRFTFAAVAFVLFAAGVSAQDNKKYESKDGKYSVGFPGTPKTESKKTGEIVLSVAAVEKGMGGFMVIYSDLPVEAVKAAKPKELLEGGQKGLVDNFKAKVTLSKDFDFGKQKLPAREILAEKDTIHLRIQIILADARLYQVFVVGPKDMVTDKDSDEFFKSFEISK
jgi:hypothetical protein